MVLEVKLRFSKEEIATLEAITEAKSGKIEDIIEFATRILLKSLSPDGTMEITG